MLQRWGNWVDIPSQERRMFTNFRQLSGFPPTCSARSRGNWIKTRLGPIHYCRRRVSTEHFFIPTRTSGNLHTYAESRKLVAMIYRIGNENADVALIRLFLSADDDTHTFHLIPELSAALIRDKNRQALAYITRFGRWVIWRDRKTALELKYFSDKQTAPTAPINP